MATGDQTPYITENDRGRTFVGGSPFTGIQAANDRLPRCANCIFEAAKDIQWRLGAAQPLTYSLGSTEASTAGPILTSGPVEAYGYHGR